MKKKILLRVYEKVLHTGYLCAGIGWSERVSFFSISLAHTHTHTYIAFLMCVCARAMKCECRQTGDRWKQINALGEAAEIGAVKQIETKQQWRGKENDVYEYELSDKSTFSAIYYIYSVFESIILGV